ncbi:molybdopterin-guanine dinucleotide biosynthesis protein B [Aciduricibacillus chroicocephali]|uniref:Molybdopterin-guanine dinucleotide biosynthesis protein B n=1 Tax=Aciduricibacillus chroicocephali TaxID=3054939 RepID=A0ABY9KXF8_9BACI|nr:molybdopterin-guanine dinucleotide biosynthesis protein B [Bacillaceae bacterium 44XB]
MERKGMKMVRGKIPVFQIVGYKNSGKTTLMEWLVEQLALSGIRAGTIKHHGHGGKPARSENTDSSRFLKAGADCSAVVGDGEWQLILSESMPLTLEQMIEMQKMLGADLILIEGFKNEHYPKIVMLRGEGDMQLLQLDNVIGAGGWQRPSLSNEELLAFSLENFEEYSKDVMELLMSR